MDKKSRTVAVIIFPGVNIVDFGGPVEVFLDANTGGVVNYDVRFVSIDDQPVRLASGLVLVPSLGIGRIFDCDDLLLPGGEGVDAVCEERCFDEILNAWAKGRPEGRLVSTCSGAMLLANAGLLDGKQATTHWARECQVKVSWPDVCWDIDSIYVQDGRIYTSAGVTASIDLAIHLVRQDCGSAIARQVALKQVVSAHRHGGQRQFARLFEASIIDNWRLLPLLRSIEANPQLNWSLETMAAEINTTTKTLTRLFKGELGLPPKRYVNLLRAQMARDYLSEGLSTKEVAKLLGYKTPQSVLQSMKRYLQLSTRCLRREMQAYPYLVR